jgi:hypothetical protein
MHRFHRARLLALTLLGPACLSGQIAPSAPSPRTPQAQPTRPLFSVPAAPGAGAAPSAAPKSFSELKPYESCDFPDGLQVSDTTPMPPDVHERPVQVHGVAHTVPLLAGERVLFTYPGAPQPYANAKIELLPVANFPANRKLLLDDFDDIIASDKGVSRSPRKPAFNGFYLVGLDRNELQTSTLGIYMLLDDHTRIAATVYFLNADPAKRKFKDIAEYARMRDTFLYNYTRCIRNHQNGVMFGGAK